MLSVLDCRRCAVCIFRPGALLPLAACCGVGSSRGELAFKTTGMIRDNLLDCIIFSVVCTVIASRQSELSKKCCCTGLPPPTAPDVFHGS